MGDDVSLRAPPEVILPLLTDVIHCHPTDDPRPWQDLSVLTGKLREAEIGRVCAMATSTKDQHYVSQLATELPGKIVPAFGYHPWFVHKIATTPIRSEQHYRSLFANSPAAEVEELAPILPEPNSMEELMVTLEANLRQHPHALVGEIGLDRVFRLPRDPKGYTREPENGNKEHTDDRGPSLGRRDRPLTNLSTPIEHQVMIARAQIEVALRLKRSISFHCVRAGGALVELLNDLRKAYPARNGGDLSKRQRKLREKQMQQKGFFEDSSDEENDEGNRMSFDDINVDLHSCTLSPAMITQIQKIHPNVYASFSIAINFRQKDLNAQIKACDPRRLLIESDWHSAEGLGGRCWTMLLHTVDILGSSLDEHLSPYIDRDNDRQNDAVEAKYFAAARFFDDNWKRFHNFSKAV